VKLPVFLIQGNCADHMPNIPKILALMLSCAINGMAESEVDYYNRTLQALNSSQPQSTCEARDSLRLLIPNADLTERAQMFRDFRSFYLKSILTTYPEFSTKMLLN
jgi:hypothetical protein